MERAFLDQFFEQDFLPLVAEKYPNNCPLLLDALREVKQKAAESYFTRGPSSGVSGAPSLAPQLDGAIIDPSILFRLELTHDCAATGCGEASCLLCERNPSRKCGSEFMADKYIEHGGLLSTCGQPMKIVLRDKSTGEIFPQDMELVVSLLKGHDVNLHSSDGGLHCGKDFRPYIDMFKLGGFPLLDSKSTTSQHKQEDGIHFRMQGGVATFPPDLTTTTSSSSHYGCKNGSFRLLVRVCAEHMNFPYPHQIQAFISKSFATVTSRARPLLKAKIPFLTDDVEKLDRMGKERAKKFESLSEYVKADGLIKSVCTVAQFQACAKYVNQHGPVRKEIIHAMKLSDVDWNRMVSHATKAVEYDNRMRYFRPRERAGTIQLIIYKCNCAVIDFATGPVGLVQDKKFVLKKDWAWQYDTIGELHRMAMDAWNQPSHPDWGIMHFDSQEFEKDPSNLPIYDEADSLSADFMQVSLESADPINLTDPKTPTTPTTPTVSPYQNPALHQKFTGRIASERDPQKLPDQVKPSMLQLLRGVPVRRIENDQNILPSPQRSSPVVQAPPLFPPTASPSPMPASSGFGDNVTVDGSPMAHGHSPIDMPGMPQHPEPPLAIKPPPSPFTYQEAVRRNITSRGSSPKSGPSPLVCSAQCSAASGSPQRANFSQQNGDYAPIQIRAAHMPMHVKDNLDFMHAQHAHAHVDVHLEAGNQTSNVGHPYAHLNSELRPDHNKMGTGLRTGSDGLCGSRMPEFEVDHGAMSMSGPLIKQMIALDEGKTEDVFMGNNVLDGCMHDAEFSFPEQYVKEALAVLEGPSDIPLR